MTPLSDATAGLYEVRQEVLEVTWSLEAEWTDDAEQRLSHLASRVFHALFDTDGGTPIHVAALANWYAAVGALRSAVTPPATTSVPAALLLSPEALRVEYLILGRKMLETALFMAVGAVGFRYQPKAGEYE